MPDMTTLSLFCRQFLGLGDPALDAPWKPDLLANIMGGLSVELGNLRIMKYAEVVKLLFNRRRNTWQLFEVVSNPARPGQLLEPKIADGRGSRDLLYDDGLFCSADINAHFALGPRNSVDRRLRNEIAVERDSSARIVVAGHNVSNAGRIAIGIDDRRDRNIEPLRLLDCDVFLIGIDHEQEIRHTAHVLDPAERAIELVALSLHGKTLFLRITRRLARTEHFVELAQPRD